MKKKAIYVEEPEEPEPKPVRITRIRRRIRSPRKDGILSSYKKEQSPQRRVIRSPIRQRESPTRKPLYRETASPERNNP